MDIASTQASSIARIDITGLSANGLATQVFYTPPGTPATGHEKVIAIRDGSQDRVYVSHSTSGDPFVSGLPGVLAGSRPPDFVGGHRYQIDLATTMHTSPTTSNGRVFVRYKDLTDPTWNTTGSFFYDTGYTVNVGTTPMTIVRHARNGGGLFTGSVRYEAMGWQPITVAVTDLSQAQAEAYFMQSPYATATGAITLGGSAAGSTNSSAPVTATGGVTLGGTAIPFVTETRTATGAVTLGGTGAIDKRDVLRSILAQSATTTVKMATMGSSTTFGSNASDAAHQYVSLLSAAFRSQFGSGGTTSVLNSSAAPTGAGLFTRNGGIGGTTAADYINSTRHSNIAILQPQIVTHMVGSNDFAFSVSKATYKANLNAAISAINAEVTGPVFHVLINAYQRMDTSGSVPFSNYGDAMQEIADANNNVMYVDLDPTYRTVWGVPGADPFNVVGTDNIHQDDFGHDLMAKLIFGLTLGFPATGGITLGGSATGSIVFARNATGGVTLGGGAVSATVTTATGGLTLGGSAAGFEAEIATATGGITLGGSAAPAGAATATGGITLGGSASTGVGVVRTATGGITLTSSGTHVELEIALATGGVTLGGTTTQTTVHTRTATGGLTLGGSADGSVAGGSPTRTATGGVTLGGASIAVIVVTATGGVMLGGTASQVVREIRTATGGLTLDITGTHVEREIATCTGGITLGGSGFLTPSVIRTATGTILLGGSGLAGDDTPPPLPSQYILNGTSVAYTLVGWTEARTLVGRSA
jgi:lysophospholipase L1-like esterase